MTPRALADRIAALDWSGMSLQHQLAVTAACETLRNSSAAAEVERAAQDVPTLVEVVRGFAANGDYVENVLPFPALRAPSRELLHGSACTERRVTLRRMDGSTVANALLARADRWDWIVETVVEQTGCSPEDVGMADDTVTVDGLPVFSC